MENFITEINIINVRHLKDIVINLREDKRTHLILTGKNGSGKTSVLEALKEYFALGFEKVKSGDQSNVYLMSFNNGYNGVNVKFKDLNELNKIVLQDDFIIAYYRDERKFFAPNETIIDKLNLKKTYTLNEKPGKDFVKYLLNLKATEAMAEKNGKPERAREIFDWFQRFDSILKKIFNNDNVRLQFDFETFKFQIEEPNKQSFSFAELSSGYAAVLDIVTDLMMRMEKSHSKNYNVEGVVLIDEVDAHLHIELQRKILPFLTELFPNIQFIVSTHSPYIVTSISNAVIFDLEKKVQFNDMSGYAVDVVAEGYFDADNYSIKIKEMIKRFTELHEKINVTDEERAERAGLRSKLEDVPGNLGLYIHSILENVEWNGYNG